MIKAEIVADSKNEFGNRITTMVVTFPRIILAEFNTHRMFSRNSASSRAIPFEKMVKSVQENPFIPIAWQKDHKGMQGNKYITNPNAIEYLKNKWLQGRDNAIADAEELRVMYGIDPQYLTDFGEEEDILISKQLVNRKLESYMYHTVIVTSTEWENFFALRCPQYVVGYKLGSPEEKDKQIFRSKKDVVKNHPQIGIDFNDTITWLQVNRGQAEIHMMALAEAMWDAYNESIPKELKAGEWHIPYNERIVEMIKRDGTNLFPYPTDLYDHEIESTHDKEWATKYKIKAANMIAARTSYTVVGQDQKAWTFDKYVEEGEKLENSNPLHASPLEHCAKTMSSIEFSNSTHCEYVNYEEAGDLMEQKGWSGNFRGFIQYRKMIKNENITK